MTNLVSLFPILMLRFTGSTRVVANEFNHSPTHSIAPLPRRTDALTRSLVHCTRGRTHIRTRSLARWLLHSLLAHGRNARVYALSCPSHSHSRPYARMRSLTPSLPRFARSLGRSCARAQYAPTSRSPRALPHHTYFSTPSTSFNAASQSGGEDRVLSASGSGQQLKAKKAALIFPGQGSQYVAMCRDIYRSFRSARSVWHLAEEALISPVNPLAGGAAGDEGRGRLDRHSSLGYIPGSGQERAVNEQQRRAFEEELTKSHGWDDKRDRRGRRGWLRDAVVCCRVAVECSPTMTDMRLSLRPPPLYLTLTFLPVFTWFLAAVGSSLGTNST